jgi:tetratricopeptide (TPR) repeat protein
MAAAGLWTTPTDLARFAIEVQLSLAGKSNKVLTREMVTRMVTPVKDPVGLGFFLEKRGNATYFGHGGADEGFRAQLLVHREKGYGAVVMVNSDNGQIMNEILRAIANEYQWEDFLPKPHDVVTVDPVHVDSYAGRYLINPDRILTVSGEQGKLHGQPTADPRFELFAIGEDTFVRKDGEVKYTFIKGESGKAERLRVINPQGNFEAPRVPPDRLVPFELLLAGKTAEAEEAYRKIKRETPQNVAVQQGRLNQLGYSLLGQKKYAEALVILKLNAEMYPASSNVYDSLGEAYMESGQKEEAIKNYRKSLELDPKNANATEMLKKLER